MALISCIVFACLEFLRQQYQTGNALLQNSFKLLNDMRPQCGGGTILLTPDPTSIDDILVEEIARLDIQATLLGHGSRQRYLVDSQPLSSIQHPDFRTVRVARKQLDALLCVVHGMQVRTKSSENAEQNVHSVQEQLSTWLKTYEHPFCRGYSKLPRIMIKP